ncbi:MAG: glycosyltransferase family 4 protein [Bacteroidetes bacterium]|nr:glycosyltransferase family 4 protein [Bacteroidota bacterium]
MKTVVLITNIPTPYRIPLFNLLSEEMRIAGLELHVIFSSLGYKRRKFEINPNDFKFSYTLLDGGKYSVGEDAEKTYFFYRGLWKQLRTIKPWRIISSGFSPATIICAFHKFIYGTPFLIWSGTIELGARKTKWWRKLFRKVLLKKATSFITYGTKASEYLEGLGAKKESVYMAMNTVDTTFFREETNAARSRIKKQDNFTFAYLGYLVPRKNVHKIIEAAAVLSKTRKDFRIIIIGDGVSKADLEREVMDQQLKGLIQFRGYLQKQELPAVFAETDALLFQTDFDIWGLVLNEAMAAGIACMASNKAGAVYDLIEEGKTGYINDFSNISQTVNKMEWMIDHKEAMERTGKSASVFIAEKASLAIAVAGFMSAIKNS